MKLQIGDTVEVVQVWNYAPKRRMLGQRLTVIGFYEGASHTFSKPHTRVRTSPPPPPPCRGWHPDALRKIEPPDWQAPTVDERELAE